MNLSETQIEFIRYNMIGFICNTVRPFYRACRMANVQYAANGVNGSAAVKAFDLHGAGSISRDAYYSFGEIIIPL